MSVVKPQLLIGAAASGSERLLSRCVGFAFCYGQV